MGKQSLKALAPTAAGCIYVYAAGVHMYTPFPLPFDYS